MLVENEDSYVQSYIQTQSTRIASETLLTLQLLERGNRRAETIAMQGCQSAAVARPSKMWRHTAVRIKTAGLVRMIWFKGFKNEEWVDFYHCRVVVFTHCQHTFMSKNHVKVDFA